MLSQFNPLVEVCTFILFFIPSLNFPSPKHKTKTFPTIKFCKTLIVKYVSNTHLGPIRGMKCTQITESQQPPSHTWDDNFLCVPRNSPFNFVWSERGPIGGKRCIEWREAADPNWRDNFLCRN